MLYLFNKTRYGLLVRAIVGLALIAVGIVGHARIALVIGAIVIVWGLYSAVAAGRARDEDERQ